MTSSRSVRFSGLAFTLVLAALIASSQAPKHTLFVWDNYVVSPDSLEYLRPFSLTSLTPPIYHWFVRVAGGRHLEAPETPLALYLTGVPFRQRLEDPYFRVVAAQKVLYMSAVLLLALSLGRATSPVVALNIVLFLVLAGLLCQSTEALVTEPVAQTWTVLLCVAFLRFLSKPTSAWLLSAGLLCVLAYLTRPAAAYAVLVPLWMCWHVRATWREHLVPSLVVLGLVGSSVAFEANRARAGEDVVTISNSARRYNRFIHAIQLMEDGDIQAIEEGRSRAFARKALARRRGVPGADVRPDLAVSSVIRPLLIEEEIGRTQVDGQPDLSLEAQQFFESIAGPVLAGKRLESVALWLRTLGGW